MEILTSYIPGALGQIVSLHGRYYSEHWNFGVFFEAKVARELAEFLSRRQPSDLVLLASDADGVAASLILDQNDPASGQKGAHLRWFIVADRLRGSGIGRDLMKRAMAHADQHSDGAVWLTTFAGLTPARHLYESFGFRLTSEKPGAAWGTEVREQEFQRPRRA
ncbi:MAG: GNAT family N-acetyltransferase [Paracoccaceae bacterium]|nr:GNAT family N-acetyltransferase [Paracoccaceae bacterium]